MTLLETRKQYQVSQAQAAALLGVPIRTYIRYERDEGYGSPMKRQAMIRAINEGLEITETKGILTVEQIKIAVVQLLDGPYRDKVEFCYLFGSYAKGYAGEKSDVDLCVSTELAGFDFAGLAEDIRSLLHKKIDLIRFNNLQGNMDLLGEIMKDGIKIYG